MIPGAFNTNTPFLEARPAVIGTNGKPASYAIKALGVVISGLITSERITVGDFEKFKKITLSNENILEILIFPESQSHLILLFVDSAYVHLPNFFQRLRKF
jgi:hypothetical protein